MSFPTPDLRPAMQTGLQEELPNNFPTNKRKSAGRLATRASSGPCASMLRPLSTCLSCLLLASTPPSAADEISLDRILKAPDAATGDSFGLSIALDLPWILVGAPNHGNGATYVFKKTDTPRWPWVYDSTLTPSTTSKNAKFGASVALYGFLAGGVLPTGPRIAIGAPLASTIATNDGAVHLFDALGNELPKLTAPTPGVADLFGWSVSMSTSYLAVGAPYSDSFGLDGGAVYLYKRNWIPDPFTWDRLTTVSIPGSETEGRFGSAVAIDHDHLVVGAPMADTPTGTDVGEAVIFSRDAGGVDQWNAIKTLSAWDEQPNAGFGEAVVVHEDVIAVGAPNHTTRPGFRPGTVYLFGRNVGGKGQWGLFRQIVASDAEHNAKFGSTLSMSGDLLVVGAPSHHADSLVPSKGSIYLYGRNDGGIDQWGEIGRRNMAGAAKSNGYGYRVAVDGTEIAGSALAGDTATALQSGFVAVSDAGLAEPSPLNRVAWGSFEHPLFTSLGGGLPDATGEWGTTRAIHVSNLVSTPEITPADGFKVARFNYTGGGGATPSDNCYLYQLVDMSPYPARVSSGKMVARLSYKANRLSGDANTDDKFSAAIVALNGDPANFATDLPNHTRIATAFLHTDNDPATWEPISVELQVPTGTTYLAIRIAALENVWNDVSGIEFDGHFADQVTLSLSAPAESPGILGLAVLNDSDVSLRHLTEPGFHYSLQKSTDLIHWTTIRWAMTGTGFTHTVVVTGGRIPETYYRIGVGW